MHHMVPVGGWGRIVGALAKGGGGGEAFITQQHSLPTPKLSLTALLWQQRMVVKPMLFKTQQLAVHKLGVPLTASNLNSVTYFYNHNSLKILYIC
jgi:hypothetical protein